MVSNSTGKEPRMLKIQIPLERHYLHMTDVFVIKDSDKVVPLRVFRKECTASGTEGGSVSFQVEEHELLEALRVLGVVL